MLQIVTKKCRNQLFLTLPFSMILSKMIFGETSSCPGRRHNNEKGGSREDGRKRKVPHKNFHSFFTFLIFSHTEIPCNFQHYLRMVLYHNHKQEKDGEET